MTGNRVSAGVSGADETADLSIPFAGVGNRKKRTFVESKYDTIKQNLDTWATIKQIQDWLKTEFNLTVDYRWLRQILSEEEAKREAKRAEEAKKLAESPPPAPVPLPSERKSENSEPQPRQFHGRPET